MQELFFCDLKPPGGSSNQWTLKSYDNCNSFTYTGPGFPAFNVIIEFNFLVQTLVIVVPKYCNDSSELHFSFFLSFLADIATKYLKQTCSFRLLLCLNLLSIDDVQILEGSRPLSLLLSVISLHHALHTKIKCLHLTPLNYFAKHLVPSE